MSAQKYSVNQQLVETLLSWVKSGEIAIPEIQRPFVWTPTKVRNLMDSLYQGFPVGIHHHLAESQCAVEGRVAQRRQEDPH